MPLSPQRLLTITLSLSLMCAACISNQRSDDAAQPAAQATPAAPAAPAPPETTGASSAPKPPEDAMPSLTGRLEMSRVASGKRLQATTLITSSGHTYLLSYRPMPEHYALLEREVIVRGEHYSPQGQAVSGDHFSVESIALAPGQQPITPTPQALPTPPFVKDLAQLQARQGYWARVQVTIKDHHKPDNESWVSVNLAAPDGTLLRTQVYAHTFESKWLPLKGKTLTLISPIMPFDPSHEPPSAAKALPKPTFSVHSELCSPPELECYSNVELEGDGPLPTAPTTKTKAKQPL